jgi:hypothetical protein
MPPGRLQPVSNPLLPHPESRARGHIWSPTERATRRPKPSARTADRCIRPAGPRTRNSHPGASGRRRCSTGSVPPVPRPASAAIQPATPANHPAAAPAQTTDSAAYTVFMYAPATAIATERSPAAITQQHRVGRAARSPQPGIDQRKPGGRQGHQKNERTGTEQRQASFALSLGRLMRADYQDPSPALPRRFLPSQTCFFGARSSTARRPRPRSPTQPAREGSPIPSCGVFPGSPIDIIYRPQKFQWRVAI